MKLDFTQCVKAARKGDADAFGQLYSLVYKDLYHIALCSLKNTHDASDVVSDAVLDAFSSIKKLKDENAFKSWIIRILIVKIKRKQSEYIKNRENTVEMNEQAEQKETDNYFNGIEIVEHIKKLTDSEKVVFSLNVIGGYKSEEISKMTNTNSATVRSQIMRSKQKLRKLLSAE